MFFVIAALWVELLSRTSIQIKAERYLAVLEYSYTLCTLYLAVLELHFMYFVLFGVHMALGRHTDVTQRPQVRMMSYRRHTASTHHLMMSSALNGPIRDLLLHQDDVIIT